MGRLNLRTEFQDLPWIKACGLRPQVWVCVRTGFSREELKEAILSLGFALNAQAFISLDQLALRVAQASALETLLSRESRQEFLSEALRLGALELKPESELRRLHRLPGFIRKLDRSFQTARSITLGPEERRVFHELLSKRSGPSLFRQELLELLPAYESLIRGTPDLPAALSLALEAMNQGQRGLDGCLPEELWVFSGARPESLESEFWDRFQRSYPIKVRFFPTRPATSDSRKQREDAATLLHSKTPLWERWHTLDDAALRLVDSLRHEIGPKRLPEVCVVIPDDPGVRRSVLRALSEGGIPLEDRRDPTRIRREEGMKSALSPLAVVASDFEREAVCSWLQAFFGDHPELSQWLRALQEHGIRSGLQAYSKTGKLTKVRELLEELERQFGGRRALSEVAVSHLRLLESWVGVDSEKLWVLQFFQRFWKKFDEDLARTWLVLKARPARLRLRAWMERIEARLRDAKPPEEREKLLGGLSLYRMNQVPIRKFDCVIFFGLPASALQATASSDFFLSPRERDLLGNEFDVQSTPRQREDLRLALLSWLEAGATSFFLDAERDQEGRERPALDSLFLELFGLNWEARLRCLSQGGLPRWARGYGMSQWRATERVTSSHRNFVDSSQKPALDASDLEAMSRCGFQALFGRRWKLEDLRRPGPDLWADASGTLLHHAVKLLVCSRIEGTFDFALSPREALEQAWLERPPHGLLRGQRVEELEKRRLTRILERFLEEERAYIRRSGAQTVVTDDLKLTWEHPEFRVQGVPDRIDEHPDGLLVADYKSGASVPQGDEMIEQGYRLQLPFYGLAAAASQKRNVIAAQFIVLNSSGSRKKGIFFKPWNGDKPGGLTTFSRKTKSLFEEAPEIIWSKAEDQIVDKSRKFIAGVFEARPLMPKECDRCRFRAVCGALRRTHSSEATSGSETGGTE